MANQWKLYYSPYLTMENNYKVDSLSTYLSSLANTITINNGQYQRNELDLLLKIEKPQAKLESNQDFFYNYMSIQNDGGAIYYYFITSKKWVSSDCIALVLKMDTLNTFAIGTNYDFTDRTLIHRQHKDRYEGVDASDYVRGRFQVIGTTSSYPVVTPHGTRYVYTTTRVIPELEDKEVTMTSTYEHTDLTFNKVTGTIIITFYSTIASLTISSYINYYTIVAPRRKIDLSTEGLTPIVYGENKELIEKDYLDWYLIYKNANNLSSSYEVVGMGAYLCASELIQANTYTPSSIVPSDLTAGRYQYLYSGIAKVDGNIIECGFTQTFWYSQIIMFEYWRDGSNIKYRKITWKNYGLGPVLDNVGDTKTTSSFDVSPNGKDGDSYGYYQLSTNSTAYSDVIAGAYTNVPMTPTTSTIESIDSLDRTLSTLYKIIKLPYCPIEYTKSGGVYSFADKMSYDSELHFLKINDKVKQFNTTLNPTINPLDVFKNASLGTLTSETSRNADYESKLYHSDYFIPKYVYDSFSFVLRLERLPSDAPLSSFVISFIQTTTANSRFMFSFNNYNTNGLSLEDYDNVLAVSRNNELTIYNSAYINYVRNGINYDVKSKNRNIITSVISGVGAIASFASSVVTGGAGIVAGIALTSSLIASVNSIAQGEQNIEQRRNQLGNQTMSINGADDVDLMSYYSSNRLKYMEYKISDKLRKALFDLFYFTGYTMEYQDVPNYTSRIWFNFLQCEPIFKNVKNIPQECLNDIIERYKLGVTFMHRYNNKYDWEREYENWETILNIPNPQ